MKNKVLLQSFLDDHAANLISVDDLLNILDPAHAPETINAPADDISFDTLYRALMVLTLDNYEEGVIWTNLCRIILGEVDEVSQKDLYIMVCLLTMTRRKARATYQTAADFERQPNAEVRTTEHNSMGNEGLFSRASNLRLNLLNFSLVATLGWLAYLAIKYKRLLPDA